MKPYYDDFNHLCVRLESASSLDDALSDIHNIINYYDAPLCIIDGNSYIWAYPAHCYCVWEFWGVIPKNYNMPLTPNLSVIYQRLSLAFDNAESDWLDSQSLPDYRIGGQVPNWAR